ncbi:hypothetical protein [Peribacillus asahii]|uniref:hypothetical protein n=1 Tax=Peribacillus asahii TaxID=228899 RepID=UPI0038003FB9
MLDLSRVKENDQIEYTGDSLAYGGRYTVVTAESTYQNPDSCPNHEKGKLMIVEFMNNGTPMFFELDRLKLEEWKIVS